MRPPARQTCFEPPRLREVMLRGFADTEERARFLTHFGLDCPACQEFFFQWAALPEPLEIEKEPGPGAHTTSPLYDPPRRALLRQRADVRGGFEPGVRTIGKPLHFLRLMLEEARHASLGLAEGAAADCVRRTLDDLRLLRRFLEQERLPPGRPPANGLALELLRLEGQASKLLAVELQGQGEHLQAEALRREAETTRLLSQIGLLLVEFVDGPGPRA